MADTVLPQPDPTQDPKPTFEPAPVPTPAPTPAPAASPSASGLAAPGAQPVSPTAPGTGAGVPAPNPTTAGTTPAAAGKEVISTLAQPAPLTPEQQKAAAAGAAAGAAASSAAASKAGEAQAKAQAGAQATASKAAATAQQKPSTPKTGAAATLDMLSPVNDTIKKMLEGDDPIAKIQFNQILTAAGPRNQALLQGLGMKLKQANLDGQGAGTALLAMMARDNEFSTEQLLANASADSAKRIWDMNVHGFDKAIEIQQEMDRQLRTDLSTAIANGQFDTAAGLWGQVYPGVPFDQGAAKAASPTATANFNSRMKLVDQFVTQGDAANAKLMMDKLAEDMPEMFGFPNDPNAAKQAVSGIDFSTEAWQNNLKATNDASAAARTAALQGDQSALSSAVDQLFSKMTPSAVESIATSAAKSRSLDEINKILTASGMAPVESTDEAQLLDKTKFAKAVKTYDLMQDSKKNVVDGLLDTFAAADPAIATDPAARTAAKAWLAMHAYGIATDPNSGAVTNFTLDDKATPPWDPSSPQAYLFNDWPVATFNPDGTVASRVYNGLTPYSADYKPGDLTTEKGKEDARLDKAYEQYVFSTPADKRLPMEQWYYATAAGTKDANPDLLTGSLKPTETPADPAAVAALQAKITAGNPLTDDDIKLAVKANALPTFQPNNLGGSLVGAAGKSFLAQHPDGTFIINGKAAKIMDAVHVDGGIAGGVDYAKIQNPKTGAIYYLLANGTFVDAPPRATYRSQGEAPKTIANPFA